MIPVTKAQELILENSLPLGVQDQKVEKALTYVLAEDIVADRPIPPFNRAAMDGFAVNSKEDITADTQLKIVGKIQTGIASTLEINPGEAIQIMTGSPCPATVDAVVKIENAKIDGEYVYLNQKNIKPGLNIAQKGEDAAKGKLLIKKGTVLTPAGIAVCASVGKDTIKVYQKPKIKIISTGTEIISPEQMPLNHQIRDCNSYALRTMSYMLDIDAEFIGIGIDEPEVLEKIIEDGLKADILLLSGGVSEGDYDHVPSLLAKNGVKKIFHHVNLKPGKPIWFGKTANNTFVFGLPGNPVSVQSCFKLFVEVLIRRLSGWTDAEHKYMVLPLSEDLPSRTNREHYTPGRITLTNGKTHIQPVNIQGSGDFSNFERSQGLIRFPGEMKILKANALIEFLPWREFL